MYQESINLVRDKKKVGTIPKIGWLSKKELQLLSLLRKILTIHVFLPKYLINKNEISLDLNLQI